MSAIENQVHIDAPLAKVYAALTTQEGVRGWWNQRCKLSTALGGESSYHFTKGGSDVLMRFRNDALDPAGDVAWRCLENTNTSWVGTTVRWKLAADGGGTRVSFSHAGWPEGAETTDGYRMVVGGWQHFMGSLKSWVETGKGQPFE